MGLASKKLRRVFLLLLPLLLPLLLEFICSWKQTWEVSSDDTKLQTIDVSQCPDSYPRVAYLPSFIGNIQDFEHTLGVADEGCGRAGVGA